MVMTGAALMLEPAVSLSGQARASTVWRDPGHEFHSPLKAKSFSPLVAGKIKAPIYDEIIESQFATPKSAIAGNIKGSYFRRLIFINAFKFPTARSRNFGDNQFKDHFLLTTRGLISGLESGEFGRAGLCLDTDVKDALRSQMIDRADLSALVLEGDAASSLLDFGFPPDQDRPVATGLAIQSNERVAACGEGTTGQQGRDKEELNARGLPREVALTEPQRAPLVPVLHQHSGLGGAKVFLGSDVEEAAHGADTIALAAVLVPLGAQVGAGTGAELIDNSDALRRAGGFGLEGSATVGFETNPFLIDLPNTGTASLRVTLLPTFSREGARGDVRASARVEQIEYTGSYDAVQNLGANFGSRFKLNERLEGNVDFSFDSGVLVTNLTGLGPVDGVPDDGGFLPGGDDITLLGLDQPRTQYQAGAGLRYQHSERDEFGASISFRADRFEEQDSQDLQESDFLAGQISYARQISSGLRIGVAVDASSIDFAEQSLGGITTISPQAIVRFTFSPTWELTGSFGIASIRSDTNFSEETSTAFTGNFSICRNGVRANLCLTGARQVVPFGVGGAGLQSDVGASYSLTLSERETFSLNANYGKASGSFLAESGAIETISGFLGYQLELAERVRLSADARYTDLRLDLGPNISNFQVFVGLTVSMGRAL